MTVTAVLLVRDEQDIIGATLDHLISQGITQIVVADNLSEDETPNILSGYDIEVVQDDDPRHDHGNKMDALASLAYDSYGADWILPCDADEAFYWTGGTLAEFFDSCEADVVTAAGWDHIATDDDDPLEPNPLKRIVWRRQRTQPHGKVAYRYHPDARIEFGNHRIEHPGTSIQALNYRHFQYRSFEQMTRKVRQGTLAVETLHPIFCTHWKEAAALDDDGLWRKWRRLCEEPGLIADPCPSR